VGLLIDASAAIALERRGAALDDFGAAIRSEALAISVLRLGELVAGVALAGDPARAARRHAFVEALLRDVEVAALDLAAGRVYGRLYAERGRGGAQIGDLDLLLAARDRVRGDGIVTLDRHHFDQVPGLRVVAPAWHQ
jgi:predicted nucleic acid-binding protein